MTDYPTVGRIVHYVSYGTPGGEYSSECRAAIVTGPYTATTDVNLAVLNPTGLFFSTTEYSENHEGGTWHWPERTS